jgi:hypothetical protein
MHQILVYYYISVILRHKRIKISMKYANNEMHKTSEEDLDNVILLTACVNPGGMAYTKLQSNDVRLQQYKEALNWYLQNTDMPVLVVENTMTDFSADYKQYIQSGRLEFLTFDGNNFDKSRGKGYGEMLIMQYAVEHSVMLSKAHRLTKITGRLIIKNLKQLLKSASHADDVYANYSLVNGHCYCKSVFFIAPVEFTKSYFLPRIVRVDDSWGYYFEHALFDASVLWIRSGHKLRKFFYPILISGMCGSSGKPYNNHSLPYTQALFKFLFSKLRLCLLIIRKKE